MKVLFLLAALALLALAAPASAEGTWGGSCAPGVVPARQSIGPYGIDPNCYGRRHGGDHRHRHGTVTAVPYSDPIIVRSCQYRVETRQRCIDGRCTIYYKKVSC
jgi:hypothetical protein